MIVDCHAHVIQNWIGACGHPARDLHMKYLQRVIAGTVARTYRARDGAPADTKALIRADDSGWSGLRDVDFRVGRFGQLEFTVDGEDYYTQYMPVGMQNLEAPPELMLAQMTYTGVDHAVLQAGGAYGAMTEYNTFAQLQYPQKFTALMHLDEAMAGTPEALAQIDRAAALGAKGLYYNFEGFARHNFPWEMDDTRLDACWDRLQAHGMVLCAEITGAPRYDKGNYLHNIAALGRVLARFAGLSCHLAMGIPVQFFAAGDRWDLPDAYEALLRRDGFFTELMFPITWGGRWDYPYREAHPLIRDAHRRFGGEKLMWGSDMPNVERFCTYGQSLEYLRRYCDFLPASDMDRILGDNSARLYRISAAREITSVLRSAAACHPIRDAPPHP
jgi:predicted TIM-barrel fold metal-dependent hydrolase